MAIHEPTTLLTDYVLGGLTAFLAWRMLRVRLSAVARSLPESFGETRRSLGEGGQPDLRNHAIRYWAFALGAVAAASFAGGTHHGFGPLLTSSSATALWKVTTLAMGVASFLLTASAVSAAFSGAGRCVLLAAAAIKLAIYVWWMSTHDAFIYVIYDYGSTLVFVLALLAANRVRGKGGHRIYLTAGILVSIVAALLQQSGIRLHAHFNHNDLMHVVQMGAVWLLYEGGRRLQDANGRG